MKINNIKQQTECSLIYALGIVPISELERDALGEGSGEDGDANGGVSRSSLIHLEYWFYLQLWKELIMI